METPQKNHSLIWETTITATAFGISASGTSDLSNAISNLLTIMALPFSLLCLYVIATF